MGELLDALERFFEADGWPIERIDGQGALRTTFGGTQSSWSFFAQAREDDQRFVLYSVCPFKASSDKIGVVAEFLTRANYGLLVGNFEVDWSDGEIRFKTGFDVESTELTFDLIRPAVYTNVLSMEKYLPGLLRVLYGEVTPAAAIDEVEGRTAP